MSGQGDDVANKRGWDIEAHLKRTVRSLPDDEFSALCKLAQRDSNVRGNLNRILKGSPVPPVIKKSLRNDDRAWRVAGAFTEALNNSIAVRTGLPISDEMTLRHVYKTAITIEREIGPHAAALWLGGMASATAYSRSYPLVEAMLVADTPWRCTKIEPLTSDRDQTDVAAAIADAYREQSADGGEHPGWDLSAGALTDLIERAAAGEPVGDDEVAMLAWMFGPDDTNEDGVGDVAEVPDLPDWPADPPAIDLEGDLAGQVEALLAAGRHAAETALTHINAGFEPMADDVLRLWHLAAAGTTLRDAAGVDPAESSLVEVVDQLSGGDAGSPLLVRLAGVEATNGAQELEQDLRRAAALALDSGEYAAELEALAALLDSHTPAPFADLTALMSALPDNLHNAVLAAATNVLTLPSLEDAEAATATVADTTTDIDEATSDVDIDEDVIDLEDDAADGDPSPLDVETFTSDGHTPDDDTAARLWRRSAAGRAAEGTRSAEPDIEATSETVSEDATSAEPADAVETEAAHTASDQTDTGDTEPSPPEGDLAVGLAPEPVLTASAAQDAAVDADPTAGDKDTPDPGRVRALLTKVLGDGKLPVEHRAAAGYWLLRAGDGDEREQTALETLAYATAMRRDGGPAGGAFDRAATRLPADTLTDDRTARIISAAAALRATLVGPWSARSFLDAISSRYDNQPAMRAIIDAVLKASLEGVQVGTAAPAEFSQVSDEDGRADELAERATELLEVGPGRNLGYQPATRVWQRWIDRERGWLGQMLDAVATDARSRAGAIRAELDHLDDRALVSRISETDKEERGHRATDIDFHGRDTLLRRARTHLDLVADWLDVLDSRQVAGRTTASYSDRVIAELRQTIAQRRDDAIAELSDTGDDKVAAAAATLAADVLNDVFDRLAEGRPYTGREPDPAARWLARPLLRTDVALDTDTWQPDSELDLERIAQVTDPPSFVDAFTRRLDRFDLDEAAAIAALVSSDATDTASEDLQRQLHEATVAAQERAVDLWKKARTDLTVAKREGYLDATAATVFDQRLDELDLTDTSGRVTEVGRALRDLQRLRGDIATSKKEQIDARRRDAQVLASVDSNVAGVLDDVLRLIDGGQLVAAEESINQAVAGIAPPEPTTPVWAGGMLGPVFDKACDIDAATRASILGGQRWQGLDFSVLDERQRVRAAQAVDAWIELAGRHNVDQPTAVSSILGALRLELPGRAVSVGAGSTAGRHHWFTVSGAVARGAPVPQFGSMARGQFQVITTPSGTSPDQVIRIIDDEAAAGTPVIHVHLGAWTAEQRKAYARGMRKHHLNDVLSVDSVAFAARLATADETWATTCAIALPWAATNPYIIDTAGRLLPPEMFFGRTEEVRALLNPTGPTIVFGGRQLGKTALLKQVAARHDTYGDATVAAYLDIKTIGQNGDTHSVWGKIHTELERAGIPMPDARKRDLEEVVTAGVRSWLDGDETRRLMVLLDEADNFLAADRDASFAQVHKLKTLMDTTERRCKVIFAGLHQVGRFQRDPNHPFAHLGRPIGVRGLDPQDAHDLLAEPLAALGYTPTDADVFLNAVTYANYHPAILQRFGYHLVNLLQETTPDGPPPWPVTHEHVQTVFDDDTFSSWVSGLVDWTLQLDRRYAVLAYTMAYVEHERGGITPLTVQEIMKACEDHDAPEFNQPGREDEIVALLDELVHLGVLRQLKGGRWQLRSRYVTRMLGDQDEITQRLVKSIDEAKTTWQEFDPAAHRRPFEGDRGRIFPLTDRQLETFCSPHPSYRVLVGSDALGIGDVREALEQATETTPTTKTYQRALTRRGGTGRPPDSNEQLHRVIVADVRDAVAAQVRRAVEQAAAWASDATIVGSVSTLVLVDAHRTDVLHDLLDDRTSGREGAPAITALRRMDVRAVELWARTAEADVGGSDAARAVIDATGGWTTLVARAAQQSLATNQMLDVAASAVAEQLTDPEHARAFVDSTGVGLLEGSALQAWELLVTYGEVSVDEFEHELAMVLGGNQMRPIAEREQQLLRLLGVVDISEGTITPEPVLVGAWQRTRQPQPA